MTILDSALAAAEGADALLVMTPWSSYASISPKELQNRLRGRVIIDPYALLNEAVPGSRFQYHRLGGFEYFANETSKDKGGPT